MKEFDWYFMRLSENVGCRPHSTQLAVERRALKITVMALYFKMGFRQIWAYDPFSWDSVPFPSEKRIYCNQ